MKALSLIRTDALPDFCSVERGGTKIWVDQSLRCPELMDQIGDCDRLLARRDCRIVKDQKKIKVGRLSLTIGGQARQIYIKRYNAFSLRYRLGSLMASSGAVKSLRGAAVLRGAGIRTARPVAAVETRRMGMLTKSFFVTEEISGGKTADTYWLEDLAPAPACNRWQRRRSFLRGLAFEFRSLHAASIYHNDLKDANIIAVAHPDGFSHIFYLLDLEGVHRCARLSEKRRVKNLVQINRTLGRHIRNSARLYFMKHYLEAVVADRNRLKRLIQVIQSESDRVDAGKGIAPVPGSAPQ